MANLSGIAAIAGFATAAQARVVLLQSGRLVHAPADAIGLQPLDPDLTAIAALSNADGNFIVGNGTTWLTESGATARTSLGLGTAATQNTGTSGATIPLLNGSNTWSSGTTQTFNGNVALGNDGSDTISVGGAFSISSGAVTTGSYTPTLTNLANLDSSSAGTWYWYRIGDRVSAWGALTVDPTADGNASTQVGISLPIASNFGATTDLAGNATARVAQRAGGLIADIANDRADLLFMSERTASFSYSVRFDYRII